MSLGRPDLYINGVKMQAGRGDPRPVVGDLSIEWGGDSRVVFDPAATCTGQLLMRDSMAPYLHVGAQVGLVDPISTRTLFAGYLEPLTAKPEESIAGALRVSFTATAPKSELEQFTVLDVDWHQDESADSRRARIGSALPRGWGYGGTKGWDWVGQGQQRYQNIEWLTLAERYARGNLQRMHDVSAYTPGQGIYKRMWFTAERPKNERLPAPNPGTAGLWVPRTGTPAEVGGTAVVPAGAVDSKDILWEKSPADVVTAVQVTTWGKWMPTGDDDSSEHEWPLDFSVDSSAAQDAYGFRSVRIETALSAQNLNALMPAHRAITNHWLDTQTNWRPTTLRLPDSRVLGTEVLLNLIAVGTRHLAAISVPNPGTAVPAPIRAFVLGGKATWTGKKWDTTLTLGRTQ